MGWIPYKSPTQADHADEGQSVGFIETQYKQLAESERSLWPVGRLQIQQSGSGSVSQTSAGSQPSGSRNAAQNRQLHTCMMQINLKSHDSLLAEVDTPHEARDEYHVQPRTIQKRVPKYAWIFRNKIH